MKKVLIWTDSHITRNNIDELEEVFDEIFSYEADVAICLGDFYDRKLLTSEELIFGTAVMKKFRDKYKDVVMLEGNHDRDTIHYLTSLGITVVPHIEIDNSYYGHFFVTESVKSFNSAKTSIDELKEYDKVFLGHQHSFQILGNKRFHPGSIIWVDFGEIDDISKNIIMLEGDDINIIELKTPIPMIDVFKLEDLTPIRPRTKVRYIIRSFEQLKKESDILEEYKNKFYQFKTKLDFEHKEQDRIDSPIKSVEEVVNDWLNTISDEEVKRELRLSFTEEK